MSILEKAAIYMLSVSLLTILGYVLLLVLFKNVQVAMASFALLSLMAAVPFLFRGANADERDRLITRRAAQLSGIGAFLFTHLVCMGVWFMRYQAADPRIDVSVLPLIVNGMAVTFVLVQSTAVLVLVRRPLEVGA